MRNGDYYLIVCLEILKKEYKWPGGGESHLKTQNLGSKGCRSQSLRPACSVEGVSG